MLGGWLISIDRDDTKLRLHTYPSGPATIADMLKRGAAVAHPTVLMRKSIVLEVGGYRRAFDQAQDYDLWVRISEHAKLDNLPDVLTYYRLHGNQQTSRNRDRQAMFADAAPASSSASISRAVEALASSFAGV